MSLPSIDGAKRHFGRSPCRAVSAIGLLVIRTLDIPVHAGLKQVGLLGNETGAAGAATEIHAGIIPSVQVGRGRVGVVPEIAVDDLQVDREPAAVIADA